MWSKKLGNYPAYSYPGVVYAPRQNNRRINTHDEFLNYLRASPKPGDWVYYTSINKSSINKFCLQYVLNVNEDYEKVTWDHYTGYPETMEILGIGPLIHNPNPQKLYPCWRPHVDYTIAPPEHIKGLLDVELQNNILRALEAFKQTRATKTQA